MSHRGTHIIQNRIENFSLSFQSCFLHLKIFIQNYLAVFALLLPFPLVPVVASSTASLIPVPASSVRKNEIRYMDFCKRVCELTGAINGYDHVRVCGERLAIHENRKAEKEIRKVSVIEFDEEWFRGKAVIVFDDVITRGISFGMYANQLESFGANVIEGIFLARTHYKV